MKAYLTRIYLRKYGIEKDVLVNVITKNSVSYYDLCELKDGDKDFFFNMADNWWNNSKLYPISLYYRDVFQKVNYCKKYVFNSDYMIVGGFKGVILKDLYEKRIKRKIINLEVENKTMFLLNFDK